jgi:hypothetical protein
VAAAETRILRHSQEGEGTPRIRKGGRPF